MGELFAWLVYDEDDGAFCSICQKWANLVKVVWVDKPFTNWKKAVEKMKSHNASKIHQDTYVRSCQAVKLSSEVQAHGTVAQ